MLAHFERELDAFFSWGLLLIHAAVPERVVGDVCRQRFAGNAKLDTKFY